MLFAKSSVERGVCSLIWKLSNLKWLKFGIKCINELEMKIELKKWTQTESLWKLSNWWNVHCTNEPIGTMYQCSKDLTRRGWAGLDVTRMCRIESVFAAVVLKSGFQPKRLQLQHTYWVVLWHWVNNLIFLNLSFLKCKWWLISALYYRADGRLHNYIKYLKSSAHNSNSVNGAYCSVADFCLSLRAYKLWEQTLHFIMLCVIK